MCIRFPLVHHPFCIVIISTFKIFKTFKNKNCLAYYFLRVFNRYGYSIDMVIQSIWLFDVFQSANGLNMD